MTDTRHIILDVIAHELVERHKDLGVTIPMFITSTTRNDKIIVISKPPKMIEILIPIQAQDNITVIFTPNNNHPGANYIAKGFELNDPTSIEILLDHVAGLLSIIRGAKSESVS